MLFRSSFFVDGILIGHLDRPAGITLSNDMGYLGGHVLLVPLFSYFSYAEIGRASCRERV